jgi:hypothetical protein
VMIAVMVIPLGQDSAPRLPRLPNGFAAAIGHQRAASSSNIQVDTHGEIIPKTPRGIIVCTKYLHDGARPLHGTAEPGDN